MDKVTQFTLKHTPNRKEVYLRPGLTISVSEKVREGNKERIQKFEGLVVATRGTSINRTVTVRKIATGGVGVEKTFVVDSPNVVEITPIKLAKIRRAKLYYMRELTGKAARLKQKQISPKDYQNLVDKYGFGPKVEVMAAQEEATEAPASEEATEANEENTEVQTEEVKEEVPTETEEAKEETTEEVPAEAEETKEEEEKKE